MSIFTLLRIYIRSFFIQAGWNFEKMQNLGFVYCMMPALRKIYQNNKDQMRSAVRRHLEFFNTHPYLAAPIIGAAIELEEAYNETGVYVENIATFKNSMMGICGGVGDSFFWGALRPFAGLFGVILALISPDIYAPLGCFILYNVVHLSFRTSMFFMGYYKGISILNTLKRIDLSSKADLIKKAQAVLLAFLLVLIKSKFIIYNFNTLFYNIIIYLVLLFAIFLVYYLIKKRISPIYIIYFAMIMVLLINYYNSKGVLWS